MATPTETRAPGGTLTPFQIASVAYFKGFKNFSQLTLAVAVALGESGGNPRARNLSSIEDSRGLWQINTRAHPNYDKEALYLPGYNATAAFAISGGGLNWRPWTVYTSGKYRQYLGVARSAASQVLGHIDNAKSAADNAEIGGTSFTEATGLGKIPGVNTAEGIFGAVGSLIGTITSPNFWARALMVIVGAIFLIGALVFFSRELGRSKVVNA